MNNILVLCIGNICRSPMAEGLLKARLPNYSVKSAGIAALVGQPADPSSLFLMAQHGLEIEEHRAQQINASLVSQADLILVMDSEQRKYVESRYSSARGKVFRLGEAEKVDIPDPYREGLESFQIAYQLIENGVTFWVDQIKRMGASF